jgi:hypothetical protein
VSESTDIPDRPLTEGEKEYQETLAARAAMPLITRRRRAIRLELLWRRCTRPFRSLVGLKHPWADEWAGLYLCGSGFDETKVTLAPMFGFTYSVWGDSDCDIFESNYGRVLESTTEWVRVELKRTQPSRFLSDRFWFVRWGPRRYLVPERVMMEMINRYNTGGMSRRIGFWYPSQTFLDDRDANPPEAPLEVPAPYNGLVLRRPLTLRVTAVLGEQTRERDSEVEFEGGSEDGAYAGIDFRAFLIPEFWRIRVDQVSARSSRGWIESPVRGSPLGREFTFPLPRETEADLVRASTPVGVLRGQSA